MTRKVFSKAIAIAVVAALCMVAVFTGIVSAETAVCTITGEKYNVGTKDTYVTAEVKFESETPFTAGRFDVSATGLTFNDCSVGQSIGGDAPSIKLNVSGKKVLFAGFEADSASMREYTSLVLVLSFTVSDRQSLEKAEAGKTWTVNITNIDITNSAAAQYATADAIGTIHVHNFVESSVSGNLRTTVCTVCGDEHVEVVSTEDLDPNDLAVTRKANVTFNAKGDTVLNALIPVATIEAGEYDNVYFIYHYKGDASDEVYASVDIADTETITIGGVNYIAFPCYGDAGVGRINRLVTGNFVTVKGSAITMSTDWQWSIKQYAETIAANEGGTFTDAQVNYAKALLDYGYYTAIALGNTSDAASYTGGVVPTGIANYPLPGSSAGGKSGTDSEWNIKGISVTTGFKPKMNIRFNPATLANKDAISIKVQCDDNIVYYKDVDVASLVKNPNAPNDVNDTYILSDIPTKYLVGEIIITTIKDEEESAKTLTYSYARYAKSKEGDTAVEGPVFQALMNWSHYLHEAF